MPLSLSHTHSGRPYLCCRRVRTRVDIKVLCRSLLRLELTHLSLQYILWINPYSPSPAGHTFSYRHGSRSSPLLCHPPGVLLSVNAGTFWFGLHPLWSVTPSAVPRIRQGVRDFLAGGNILLTRGCIIRCVDVTFLGVISLKFENWVKVDRGIRTRCVAKQNIFLYVCDLGYNILSL